MKKYILLFVFVCACLGQSTSFPPNSSSGPVGPYVIDFNTRSNHVTLSSGDVTTALGFTPVQGPGSAVNGHVATFNGTGGGLLSDGGAVPSITGLVAGAGNLTTSGCVSFETTSGTITCATDFIYTAAAGTGHGLLVGGAAGSAQSIFLGVNNGNSACIALGTNTSSPGTFTCSLEYSSGTILNDNAQVSIAIQQNTLIKLSPNQNSWGPCTVNGNTTVWYLFIYNGCTSGTTAAKSTEIDLGGDNNGHTSNQTTQVTIWDGAAQSATTQLRGVNNGGTLGWSITGAGAGFFKGGVTAGASGTTGSLVLTGATSGNSVTLTVPATASTQSVIFNIAPAATGTRYICVDTTGTLASSASACSGT